MCAGGEEAGLEVWGVVAGEEDGAEGEVGVEGTGEAAGEDEGWSGGVVEWWSGGRMGKDGRMQGSAEGFVGVALAHAGEEDLDIWVLRRWRL